jgi:uncharacterized membrane protein YedE/YeeE
MIMDLLQQQLPWYVGGPVVGLCVVAIRLLLNGRLGATGAFSEVVERVGRRSLAFDWRGWFFFGLVAGGLVFLILHGGPSFEGYGWLTETFTGSSAIVIAPILLVAGVLIGFGAKAAGGCTSGNGLSGTAMASPASLAATATFFATGIVVSFATEAVI